MRELNETVRNMNDFAMLLTFTWEDERKNFSRSISIFFLNVVIIWSMLLRFSDKNWESFLDIWLSILAHFAKRHIDLSASLSSCICDLKCACFICRMILFLWSLCFRYLFHASNVSCVFHMICSHLLRAYQGWIELASASSPDLAQPLFSFINISLFNIIFLSTSHSTRVTNTFSSSLAQSLNIT